MLVMTLDVGTSSTRALCFDAGGHARPGVEGRVAYEPRVTPDGGAELAADALFDAVLRAVDECLAGAGPAVRIEAVGISAFWHGLLALDGAGAPLTPVITWADTRSGAAAAALRRRLDADGVHARTGAPLHPAFFPAKLAWLRQDRPEVFARARRWCGFAEYLVERLTGAWRGSVSMASGTGLLDQERLAWDEALLEACGVAAATLPPVDDAPAPGLLPAFASRWPALAAARWFPAWGDGACSSLGSDCAEPDRIALNVGTSAAMRVVTGQARPAPPGLWRYRVDGGRSVIGGATSEGGNVVAWCRRVLALPADSEAVERAVAAVPPAGHGVAALPFLAGERSPGWRHDARGALTGLALGTGPAEILRALMEAVAFRLALIHERLHPVAAPDPAVIASGGALTRSPAWTRILADVLGVPITLSRQAEASSRGAALLALSALGLPLPAPASEGEPIAPDAGRHATYREALARHRRLYETVVGPRMS